MSQSSGFDLHSDDGARRLLYLCAFMFFFMPYFQGFAGIWPFQLGSVEWRWKATGGLSGILMLPFLGMALALVVARLCGHKGVARTIGVVSALTTVTLLIAMGLYAMDTLQLKKIVNTAATAGFNKMAFTAAISLIVSFLVFALLTVLSFRPPQGEMRVTPPKTKFKNASGEDSPGLLIGQDYTK